MLKPSESLMVGLAAATVAYAIYSNATPSIADIRVGEANDADIAASERLATWTAAGVVAGISLLAKDATVFTIGGATVVCLAWWHRHANAVNPVTGKANTLGMERDADLVPEAA